MSEYANDCPLCDRARGGADPVGGWVLREGEWGVGVFPDFEVPGWVFVELHTRHAEGPWSLRPDEAATLGPVLSRVSNAIRTVTGAERVYWMAFGELFPHFHVLLAPRLPGTPPDERGPALFGARAGLRDIEASAAVADQLREALAAQP